MLVCVCVIVFWKCLNVVFSPFSSTYFEKTSIFHAELLDHIGWYLDQFLLDVGRCKGETNICLVFPPLLFFP